MAQQTINNGDTGLQARTKINENFTETYSLINGGYTDITFVNSYSGVDFTGATDSKVGLQAALDAGFAVVVFDGLYRTTEELNINANQTVIIRGGTVIELYGNVNTGVALFELNNGSHILAEPGARLTHTPTGTASYSGIYVTAKTGWSIQGKMTIDSFGNQGIRILGTPSSPNQYRNGLVKDVICKGNINNGFGGASGAGHGIELTTAEYVYILDCDIYDNAGYGIYFDRAANCPINNTRIIGNTLGGLRIDGDYASNTDHFHVSNCQINHNDDVGAYNVYVKDVDTGVSFNGCSIFGGIPFKVENSRGVSFTGCGLADGTSGDPVVIPGSDGDGMVTINGGYVLYSPRIMKTNVEGGGGIIFKNVRETVITEAYSSSFTASADSWTASGTTLTGNIDTITDGGTSFDNTLRIAGDAATTAHYAYRATTLTSGNAYKIYITVYIPTANTAADGVRLVDSGGYVYDFTTKDVVKGKWVTLEHEWKAGGTEIRVYATKSGEPIFNMPATDYVYIARVKLWSLGAGDVTEAPDRAFPLNQYFPGKISFDNTITTGGTTGNQTINKPSGTVNIAAAGTTVTVTNSFCTANSIVHAVIRTNDATAYIANVVPAAGSFVINLGAAATAEISIGFFVMN